MKNKHGSISRHSKRTLSIILALCVVLTVFTVLPKQTYAAGTPDTPIDINVGTVSGNGSGYTATTSYLTIIENGYYRISGSTTGRALVINGNLNNVNITLNSASIKISVTQGCAFEINNGSTVRLTLIETNSLSSSSGTPGLAVSSGATLIVTAESTGSLTSTGGSNAPGIGGEASSRRTTGAGSGYNAGTITINGGTINANGGSGIGIGGGDGGFSGSTGSTGGGNGGSGGTITINGGTVNGSIGGGAGGRGSHAGFSTSGSTAGNGGSGGNGGTVTINGGTLKGNIIGGTGGSGGNAYATGTSKGGTGGTGGNGGTVIINGGTVNGYIRGGTGGSGGNPNTTSLSGGNGGSGGSGWTATINSGTVINSIIRGGDGGTNGGDGGNGGNGGNGGTVKINGGTVTLDIVSIIGGDIRNSIGGGSGGNGSSTGGKGGNGGSGGDVTISGGTVSTGPIGGGNRATGASNGTAGGNGTLVITGGNVNAKNGAAHAVDRSTSGSQSVYPVSVTVMHEGNLMPNMSIEATTLLAATYKAETGSDGIAYIWLPTGSRTVTAYQTSKSIDVSSTETNSVILTLNDRPYTTKITVPAVNGIAPATHPGNPVAVKEGITVNLPAVFANSGFEFVRWEGTGASTSLSITNPTSASTASFKMGSAPVTVNAIFKAAELTFGNKTLTTGTVGVAYSANITAPTGGSGTYAYAVGGTLPAGISMSNAGVFSGTPSASVIGHTFPITATDTKTEATKSATYTLTINSYIISASALTSFGSLQTPYTQPSVQTVTITNTGTGSITLTQPSSTKYDIGTLSTANLAANGATATFTVRPKAGLAVGNHDETITVNGNNGASATVNASFAVTPTYIISAATITSFGSLQTPYTQPGAQTVTITNTGIGSITLTQPSSTKYDIGTLSTTNLAANGATATFTVRPKAGLAVGNHDETITVNGNNGASATVNASFAVTPIPAVSVNYTGFSHPGKPITLIPNMPDYDVYYTIDGTDPQTSSGILYEYPITLTKSTTIKAIARKYDNISEVASFDFFVFDPLPSIPLEDSKQDTMKIARGESNTLALKTNGTVISDYASGSQEYNEINTYWRMITDIAVGGSHAVGLRSNGKVVSVGDNSQNQRNVSDWRNIVAISTGTRHTVGLVNDGTVISTVPKNFNDGQSNTSSWSNIVAISAGDSHTVGLQNDGKVVAVGDNSSGQCNVDLWVDIVKISAGSNFTVGLKRDGTVIATGDGTGNKCSVGSWGDIVSIYAQDTRTIGIKLDGTVITTDNLSGLSNIKQFSDGYVNSTLGIKGDGTLTSAIGIAPTNLSWGTTINNNVLPGAYPCFFTIALSTADKTSEIYYTLDGRDPSTSAGRIYSSPIKLDFSTTIRMQVKKNGIFMGEVTYFYDLSGASEEHNPSIELSGMPKNQNGEIVGAGNFNNTKSVNLNLDTTVVVGTPVTVIIAFYTGSNNLCNMEYKEMLLEDDDKELTIPLSKIISSNATRIKIFIWDENMVPYTNT